LIEKLPVVSDVTPLSFVQQEESVTTQIPTRFTTGAHVRVNGLQASVDLNGKDGVVQTFDVLSGRYVVQIDGARSSKKIRPEHLSLLDESDNPGDEADAPLHFNNGAHVFIFGLHQLRDLNGKTGVIRHFDSPSGRYVVEVAGQPPRKIKAENIQLANHAVQSSRSPPKSVCDSASDDGPSGLPRGSKVVLYGLQSAVARSWNGLVGTVHCFDQASERYVVALPDGTPRKLRPSNLHLEGQENDSLQTPALPPSRTPEHSALRSVCDSSSDEGPSHFPRGSKVELYGLQSAVARSWNGLVATVHCFDQASERYVVAMPDGTPRKLKPSNLHLEGEEDDTHQEQNVEPSDSLAQHKKDLSICKQQASHGFMGPGGFVIGSKVQLHGLQSAAAQSGHWNGMIGVVHCFDASSQRYVVACPDGQPRKIKPANLVSMTAPHGGDQKSGAGATSICQQQATQGFVGPGGLAIGSKVVIHGLQSPAAIKSGLNGMPGVVHCFDMSTHRSVVSCPDGMPRKLKLENLQRSSDQEADALPLPHAQSKPTSICQPESAQGPAGPGGLAAGMKVALFGLTSQAAIKGSWNGMVGVVHCYDASSQRYVVAMADGTPRRLKVENLAIVTNAVSQSIPSKVNSTSETNHPIHWIKGAYVRLLGLKVATELNGQVGSVVDFENSTKRYVIKVPGSAKLKRVKAANLADVAVSEPTVPPVIAAVAHLEGFQGAQQPHTGRQLSVCNAYATHSAIQVFAVSSDGKHYTHLVKNFDFQACSDVDNVPGDKVASLAFVIGKFQVAKKNVDFAGLTPGQGLELVVHRNDPNSLKAIIHENPVELGDTEAYYLHLVDAYAGKKPLTLEVQRGKFVQKMPLDKTYRLSSEQPIKMVLSDGVQKLKLTFQPKRGGTYCVMTTGVDPGLKGEPRNVGLVAHQIGAWTSSEEMENEDADASASEEVLPRSQAQDQGTKQVSKDSFGQMRPSFSLSSMLGKWFGHA
jgi:hypothetical protein